MLGIYYVFSYALSFSHFYPMHPVQKYNNNRLRERSKVFGINSKILFCTNWNLKTLRLS